MRGTRAGLLPALLLASSAALPQAAAALDLGLALPSAFRVAGTLDDEGGYDYSLDLDQALPGGQRLLFTYGTGLTVTDDGDIEPRTLAVGVSSDPLDLLTLAIKAEDWGQEDEILTRSLEGDALLRSGGWQFGLGLRMRSIEIFLQPPLTFAGEDSAEINSEGIEYSIGVQASENLYVGANYFNNNYSRDLGFLDEPVIVRDIIALDPTTSVTFSLAAGLQEEGGGFNASVFTDWGSVNFDYLRSVSAVDGEDAALARAGIDVDIASSTTLQLGAGLQSSDDDDDLYIGEAALLFSW